jgi:molecular chaperone HtpG
VDEADIDVSSVGEVKEAETPTHESLPEDSFEALRKHFADVLGERVREVRASKSLTDSPARLVSDESSTNRNMYRINRLLDKEYQLPVKILELNPHHPLMHNLSGMLTENAENTLVQAVVEQVFETALLQDGIHPDPASMADRLTMLMEAATALKSESAEKKAPAKKKAPRKDAKKTESDK